MASLLLSIQGVILPHTPCKEPLHHTPLLNMRRDVTLDRRCRRAAYNV